MPATNPSTESIDLVTSVTDEVYNEREFGRLAELLAPGFVQHGTPSGAEAHGAEEFEGMVRMYHDAFSDFHSAEVVTVADDAGEYVCSVRTYTGTHDGPFMGTEPTGSTFEVMGVCLTRVADGKLAEQWEAMDFLGLLQQLGMLPSMGEIAA